jgi:hypothetical protein
MAVKSGNLAHLVRDIKGVVDKVRTPQQGPEEGKTYVDMVRSRRDDTSPVSKEVRPRVTHPDWVKVSITFPY